MQKSIPTRRDPWARWAKIIFAIAVCATLLALAGGQRSTAAASEPSGVDIYRGPQTGCDYVAHPYAHTALTPRMDRNGKQVCK